MINEFKLNISDVLPLAYKICTRNELGCCLYVVLEKLNVDDEHIYFCLQEAKKNGHEDCEQLSRLLFNMSKTQIKKLSQLKTPHTLD